MDTRGEDMVDMVNCGGAKRGKGKEMVNCPIRSAGLCFPSPDFSTDSTLHSTTQFGSFCSISLRYYSIKDS